MAVTKLPIDSSLQTNTIHVLEPCSENSFVFDSALVSHLECDHKELLGLFDQVLNTAKSYEFGMLQLSLVEFATSFTTHINIEDEQLYGYIINMTSRKSKPEQKIVSDFADEMKDISISIIDLLRQSTHIPITKHTVSKFIKEFEKIGEKLADRIEREERVLYPMYLNSQA